MSNSHYKKLENMFLSAPINKFYQPKISISEGFCEVEIPIKKEFFHAAHAVHGSVYFKALDDSAFFAANSLVEDVFVLTTNFNLYLTRPISEGTLIGKGKVVSKTKSSFIVESQVLDSEGREIARGSGLFVRSKIPLTEDIGYG